MFEIFWIFLRLGCTSFGGPIAHLSYFHNEFVEKRKWFDDQSYADVVALCQFLPGPASSQVGMAVGLSRAGVPGAIVAWLGFTLPSFVILLAFAYGISSFNQALSAGWLHGLKIVAVAVVTHALWGMAVKLTPDINRIGIALFASLGVIFFPTALAQIGVILIGAFLGRFFVKEKSINPDSSFRMNVRIETAVGALVLFLMLLMGLPLISSWSDNLKVFDAFYRAGALVFGGGHVVLPLLKAEVVNAGWVSADVFMAGYGASQALPGPLFTFSAYLGAVSNFALSGVAGAVLCLCAVFLPSLLMVVGAFPFWQKIRHIKSMRNVMAGVNASVVGLLLAALYNPVWTSAIFSVKDFLLAAICFVMLMFWRTPSWGVVIFGAIAGGLIY